VDKNGAYPVAMDALKQDEAIEAMNMIRKGQVKGVEQGSSVS
jgi:hypothetical protein